MQDHFPNIYFLVQHLRRIFHFVRSLIAPLSDSLAFLFSFNKKQLRRECLGSRNNVVEIRNVELLCRERAKHNDLIMFFLCVYKHLFIWAEKK